MFTEQYIYVIVPLALPKMLTYAVPEELISEVAIGKRVEVSVGKRRIYTGIVHSFMDLKESDFQVKPILSVIDEYPIIHSTQIRFWEWIAQYYMCTLGEVMDAALPSALKLDSETSYCKHPYNEMDKSNLSDEEFLIAEAFEFQDELSYVDIQQIIQKKSANKIIRSLIEKGYMFPKESLIERYIPKTQFFVTLTETYSTDKKALQTLFEEWKGAPKQMDLLLAFFDLSKGKKEVIKGDLLKKVQASPASLDALVKKGVFQLEERIVNRIDFSHDVEQDYKLNEAQRNTFNTIVNIFEKQDITLLHGVTSSGKTLIYAELIKEVLQQGKEILYLVPEIALTAQLVARLRKLLGTIGVYHSKFNPMERVETWNQVLKGEIKIVVGPRSALFLPFKNLGLIIVDEEHDASFKQQDPAPRYQGRDTAIVLANLYKAKTLLGTATPSLESFYNAEKGKYGLVQLLQRFGDVELPQLEFINLQVARKQKELTGGISFKLKEEIDLVLANRGQVILFHNRRGYAPYLACSQCEWIPFCKNCDVSLTYHKFTNDLRCHYCGYRQSVPHQCKQCQTPGMEQRSMGTERIEDDLNILFPEARIARMDYDAVKTKKGHEKIIEMLENREVDILVGTQMVTKGLDFGNVQLVGVINADSLLFYPDFRSFERAFQLLVQVSGRAGRIKQGKVCIQISDTLHPIVSLLRKGNYEDFYTNELQERRQFMYPPFTRLVQITIKDKDTKVVAEAAELVARELRNVLQHRVIGPNKPVIGKVQNLYIREVILKLEKDTTILQTARKVITDIRNILAQYQAYKQVRVTVDVDTY